LFHFKNE